MTTKYDNFRLLQLLNGQLRCLQGSENHFCKARDLGAWHNMAVHVLTAGGGSVDQRGSVCVGMVAIPVVMAVTETKVEVPGVGVGFGLSLLPCLLHGWGLSCCWCQMMEEGMSYESISSIRKSVSVVSVSSGIDYRPARWVVYERCDGLDDGAGSQHGGIGVTLLTGLLHGWFFRGGGGSGGDQVR